MYADDAINVINKFRTKEIVLTTMTPGRYWKEISEKPEIDFPVYGVMGKASSVGLGLSLAKPDQKILVLDGDGGLLMNLGSLVTISSADPKNFIHIVFDDGVYYTTGSQPIPGKDKYDFKSIAVGSGIEKSYSFDDLETFSAELESPHAWLQGLRLPFSAQLLSMRSSLLACRRHFWGEGTPSHLLWQARPLCHSCTTRPCLSFPLQHPSQSCGP